MALIPPFFLDTTVAIGVTTSQWIGTGFLVGRFAKTDDEGEDRFHIYLVTNKHVLEGQRSVVLRFNPTDDRPAHDFGISLVDEKGLPTWTGHPDKGVDVAVLNIVHPQQMVDQGINLAFFRLNSHILTVSEMQRKGVSEGDFVYTMGFPLGLVEADRKYVICRSGTIARIRDLYEKRSEDFLIDAMVYPGNSGGPVVTKPEDMAINGTEALSGARLIGLVKSYLPYQEVAYSRQTNRPRMIFEENSGLANVVPVDRIVETVEICHTQKYGNS